jgi:hypothetical protein
MNVIPNFFDEEKDNGKKRRAKRKDDVARHAGMGRWDAKRSTESPHH